MSTRPTHRQKYPSRGKKGNRKYKYHFNKEEIIDRKTKKEREKVDYEQDSDEERV